MKKTTLIAITLSAGLAVSTTPQAAVIQLLQDNVQLNTQVYWPDNPGTPSYKNAYSGRAFNAPTYLSSLGKIWDNDGYSDGQRAGTALYADNNWLGGSVITSYTFPGGDCCSEIYDAVGVASIDLDWTFKVNGDGAGVTLDGVDNGFGGDIFYFSLFDETLDTMIASGDIHSGGFFSLLNEHVYTLNMGTEIASSGDPGSLAFYAAFDNATIYPVPEPTTLALFSLGLGLSFAGLLVTKRTTSKNV